MFKNVLKTNSQHSLTFTPMTNRRFISWIELRSYKWAIKWEATIGNNRRW